MDIKAWTNYIIEIYNKSETVDVYERRRNNESINIKAVLRAIQTQRFSMHNYQNRSDFIHLLKAADSISLDIGTNYLEQFLQVSDVQQIISKNLTPDNLAKVIQKAKDNEQTGNLPNFPKTVAEVDKIFANDYLSSFMLIKAKEEMSRFNKYILGIPQKGKFSVETDAITLQDISKRQNAMLRLGRVMLRQQGMNPGSMNLENGIVSFSIDIPDKPPIYHGMQQEQGLSIAQQEKLKKEQEAEQRYEQELENNKKDREAQIQLHEYSIAAKKNREAKQRPSNQSSILDSFMQRSEEYKAKNNLEPSSNTYRESLRYNVENTNRTNQLQGQNKSDTRKRSNSMGMSR